MRRILLITLVCLGLVVAFAMPPLPVTARGQELREQKHPVWSGPRTRARDHEVRKYAERLRNQEKQRRKERTDSRQQERAAKYKIVEMWAPYWEVDGQTSSALIVNNTQARPISLEVRLMHTDGKQVALAMQIVPPLGSLDIALKDLEGGTRGKGHLVLRYKGAPLEVNAQMVVTERGRFAIDHALEFREAHTSTSYEGLFYVPSANTKGTIALTNTSSDSIAVDLTLQTNSRKEETVKVQPHQTRLVDLQSLIAGVRPPFAGSASISHDGKPGDLLVQGMLRSPTGFATNMRFRDADALDNATLFSPLIETQQQLRTLVLLRNVNKDDVGVHLEAYFTLEGSVDEQYMNTVLVPGKGAVFVDLTDALRRLPPAARNKGLILEYDAPRGGLLADVLRIDESTSAVMQVSPKGYAGDNHAVHSFAFRIDGPLETVVTVANPSEDETKDYDVALFYGDDETYTLSSTPLRPGEVRNIDIKALRDQQVQGLQKKTIPRAVTTGQVKVYFHSTGQPQAASEHAGHYGHGAAGGGGISGATIRDTVTNASTTSCWPAPEPYITGIYLDSPYNARYGGTQENVFIYFVWDDSSLTELGIEEPNACSYCANLSVTSANTDVATVDSGYPPVWVQPQGVGAALIEVNTGTFWYDYEQYGPFYGSTEVDVWRADLSDVDIANGTAHVIVDGITESETAMVFVERSSPSTYNARAFDETLGAGTNTTVSLDRALIPAGTYFRAYLAYGPMISYYQNFGPIEVNPLLVHASTLANCPLEVERAEPLGIKLVFPPTIGPTVDWSFTDGNNNNASENNGPMTWSGNWAASGTVTASINSGAATPTCYVTVTPRAEWRLFAPAPTAQTWAHSAFNPWGGTGSIGYSDPALQVSANNLSIATVTSGPNKDFKFLNQMVPWDLNGTHYYYDVTPDFTDANSLFYKNATCNTYPGNQNGYNPIAALKSAIEGHEATHPTVSHYKQFWTAFELNNYGAIQEGAYAKSDQALINYVSGELNAAGATIFAATAVEPAANFWNPNHNEYIGKYHVNVGSPPNYFQTC
jgi:hypothetical protein